MPLPVEVLCWLVAFILFLLIQGLMINGVHYCCQGACVNEINKGKVCNGNIFYKINPSFFERSKNKWWSFPIFSCVRCMSSLHGTLSYWPLALWVFGFNYWQIAVWVVDMFCLIGVNYWIYKKL